MSEMIPRIYTTRKVENQLQAEVLERSEKNRRMQNKIGHQFWCLQTPQKKFLLTILTIYEKEQFGLFPDMF